MNGAIAQSQHVGEEEVAPPTPVLAARGLEAGYNGRAVIRGMDIEVGAGEVVAMFGPNGAGKTTTLLALAGALAPLGGEVLDRGDPTAAPLHRRTADGLAFISEERSVFPQLTTLENLHVGRCDVDVVLELFPELRPLL